MNVRALTYHIKPGVIQMGGVRMGRINTQDIYEQLREIKVIDTHEHLWDEEWRLEHPGDWTGLFYHYGITALRMAGMKDEEGKELFSEGASHKNKWDIFNKYFKYAGNSAYIKAVELTIKGIYGIDEITNDSMYELTAKIKKAVKKGFYRTVINEKCGIDYCMVNSFDCDNDGNTYPARLWGDTDIMRPDIYADVFIYPTNYRLIQRITGKDCSNFSGWLEAVNLYFHMNAAKCCSIKIGMAYHGDLKFDASVTKANAEQYYNKLLRNDTLNTCSIKPLVDYMFKFIIVKAKEYKLPLKFHTGLLSGANVINAGIRDNVKDLVDLAVAHPQCNFIAMHIAYPFQDELVMAVRQVTNLYADMAWSWLVDIKSASMFLEQMLTAAPVTKIMGFGGDYSMAENVYGHLEIARKEIARVLCSMENNGYIDNREAVRLGKYVLRESARKLYSGENC